MNSVGLRPSSPASNLRVGVQRPKSRPAMEEATKPPKVPITASVMAPAPPAVAAPEAAAAGATVAAVVAAAALVTWISVSNMSIKRLVAFKHLQLRE